MKNNRENSYMMNTKIFKEIEEDLIKFNNTQDSVSLILGIFIVFLQLI